MSHGNHSFLPINIKYHPGFWYCYWLLLLWLLQMIIWKDRPHANEYLEGPASCQWSFEWTGLFQMIIRINQIPPTKIIFSFKTFVLLLQNLGSRFNLADLSRTMCSCFLFSLFLSTFYRLWPSIQMNGLKSCVLQYVCLMCLVSAVAQ